MLRDCEFVYTYITPNPVGDWCRSGGDAMDAVDQLWRQLVNDANDPTSDGIVPGARQRFPKVAPDRQVLLASGPSHTGETKDVRVYQSVRAAMERLFGFREFYDPQ